jgi:hypothetical protein
MTIFVSYASVDDLYDQLVTKRGWVTTLLNLLRIKLAQKLGRETLFELWRDQERLKRNESLSRQLCNGVRSSDTLLIVLSEGYLKSEWCGRELHEFLDAHGESARDRVFVVERDEIARLQRPAELRDLLGYPFWTKVGGRAMVLGDPVIDPAVDREYFSALEGLSAELAAKLQDGQTPPGRDNRPCVFLAWTTDDLGKRRRDIRQYLLNNGVRVLPEKQYALSRDEFAAAAKEDLADAQVFAQLLSDEVGFRPPDVAEGFAALQLALAREAGVPLLRWRPTEAAPDQLDPEIQPLVGPLLEGWGLVVESFEAFKDRVVAEALRALLPAEPVEQDGGGTKAIPSIFVNYDRGDSELAEAIEKTLRTHWNVDTSLAVSDDSWSAREKQEDLENSLIQNDTMLCVYGRVKPIWVRNQLYEARRIRPRREADFTVLGVYQDDTSPPKPGFGLNWESIVVLGAQPGTVNPTSFERFIRLLKQGRDSHAGNNGRRSESAGTRDAAVSESGEHNAVHRRVESEPVGGAPLPGSAAV